MNVVGNYIFQKEIGKGHYAIVSQGKNQLTGKLYAIKQIKKNDISKVQFKNIENEIRVLEQLDHSNIIKMTDKYKSENHYYIMLEYCNGGDLQSYI